MQKLMGDMNDVLDDLEFSLGKDAVDKLRAQLQSVAASGMSDTMRLHWYRQQLYYPKY